MTCQPPPCQTQQKDLMSPNPDPTCCPKLWRLCVLCAESALTAQSLQKQQNHPQSFDHQDNQKCLSFKALCSLHQFLIYNFHWCKTDITVHSTSTGCCFCWMVKPVAERVTAFLWTLTTTWRLIQPPLCLSSHTAAVPAATVAPVSLGAGLCRDLYDLFCILYSHQTDITIKGEGDNSGYITFTRWNSSTDELLICKLSLYLSHKWMTPAQTSFARCSAV